MVARIDHLDRWRLEIEGARRVTVPSRKFGRETAGLLAMACLWLAVGASVGPGRVVAADDDTPGAEPTDGAWELIRDDDGIQTFRMDQPDSPLLAFKGEGVIDAPIERVLSVCLDAERATEWIGLVAESAVLRWADDGDAYVQLTRFDLPWPVRDRVFVSRVVIEHDRESWATTLIYHEADEAPAVGGAILGSTEGTRFVLRPVDGGTRTFFSGIGIADPKGAIPAWFINWAGRSIPHRSLESLRRQVGKDDITVSPLAKSLYEGFEPGD